MEIIVAVKNFMMMFQSLILDQSQTETDDPVAFTIKTFGLIKM
jgi:hypothetical protein